jgi:ankyrin repeat protein
VTRHNRVEDVERMLDMGVPVHITDQYGNSVLSVACQNGHKRIAKAALRRGIDINGANSKGNTPL